MAFIIKDDNGGVTCYLVDGQRIPYAFDTRTTPNWIMHKGAVYQLWYSLSLGGYHCLYLDKLLPNGRTNCVSSIDWPQSYIPKRGTSVQLMPCGTGYIGCIGADGIYRVVYVDIDARLIELREELVMNHILDKLLVAWDDHNQRLHAFYTRTSWYDKYGDGSDMQEGSDLVMEYGTNRTLGAVPNYRFDGQYMVARIFNDQLWLHSNLRGTTATYDLVTGDKRNDARRPIMFPVGGTLIGQYTTRSHTNGERLMVFAIVDMRTGDKYEICQVPFVSNRGRSIISIIPCSMQSLPADGHTWPTQ